MVSSKTAGVLYKCTFDETRAFCPPNWPLSTRPTKRDLSDWIKQTTFDDHSVAALLVAIL